MNPTTSIIVSFCAIAGLITAYILAIQVGIQEGYRRCMKEMIQKLSSDKRFRANFKMDVLDFTIDELVVEMDALYAAGKVGPLSSHCRSGKTNTTPT